MHIPRLQGKMRDREICGLREWGEGVGVGTRHRGRREEADGRGMVGFAHTNKVASRKNTESEALRTDGKDWAGLLARGSL